MNNHSFYFVKIWRMILNPKLIKDSKISKKAKILSGASLRYVEVDDYTYIGENTTVSYCSIGKFCSIAGNTSIGGGSHPLDFVSTSPVFCQGKNTLKANFSQHQFNPYKTTTIGNDVWIGKCSCIKAGVKIGDGAVIGMGTVVTKDIGPYEIWVGNPARMIRKRFDDEVIDGLLQSKWWQLDDGKIKELAESFDDVNAFIENVKGKQGFE